MKLIASLLIALSLLSSPAASQSPPNVRCVATYSDVQEVSKLEGTSTKEIVDPLILAAINSQLMNLAQGGGLEKETNRMVLITNPDKDKVLIVELRDDCVLYYGVVPKDWWDMLIQRTMANM
jgi:hypothetical protein